MHRGRRRRARKRCTECRRWFEPHAAATKHQKSCSTGCRAKRRRRLARRRRARELREYRVDERERQRACRARRRGEQDAVVSRAGLAVEVPAFERDLLEIVDRHVELSRAGLRREVARLLRLRAWIVDQNVVAAP
jgi:hypothetical protein